MKNLITKTVLIILLTTISKNINAEEHLIVFAANLESTGGVCREDHSGADLYSVQFDPDTKNVSNLKRLTNYADASEWFPSMSPDTKWIAYNYQKNLYNEVRLIHRKTGNETIIFEGGRFPEWIGNSELLISNKINGKKDVCRLILDLTTSSPTIKSIQRITNRNNCPGTSLASDAYPFPDEQQFVFHILRENEQPGAAIATINLDGTNFQRITDWDGSGHGVVNSTGQEIICSKSGSALPQVLRVEDNPITHKTISLPLNASDLFSYDERYQDMSKISYSYVAWANENYSLFLSTHGSSSNNSSSFSRLLYASFDNQWENPTIFDFSSAVEDLAGKNEKDFCTASSRKIPTESNQTGVVYVALFMHNEDFYHQHYPDYSLEENREAYIETRNQLLHFCEMIHQNNIPFNWETDWNFLYGVMKWDTPDVTVNTGGKNIVKYIHEDLNISVDPHSHENLGHNYADVAFLIDSLGVELTNVIGGHIWDPDDRNFKSWERFRTPLRGKKFPQALWKGDILMGHGTSKHVNDPAPSGVWKPKGIYEFWTHDSTGTVCAVGQYKSSVKGIHELLDLYDNGTVPAEKLLTTTIGINQFELDANYIGWYKQEIIKPLLVLQDSGQVKILLFEQLIELWKENYDSIGYLYNAPAPTNVISQESKPNQFNLKQNYPNPFNSSTEIRYQLSTVSVVELIIYDQLGRKVRTLKNTIESAGDHSTVWDGKDDVGNTVSSGIYFYKFAGKDGFEMVNKMLFLK